MYTHISVLVYNIHVNTVYILILLTYILLYAYTHYIYTGIGLAAMATADVTLFEELRQVLFIDNAIAGEGVYSV